MTHKNFQLILNLKGSVKKLVLWSMMKDKPALSESGDKREFFSPNFGLGAAKRQSFFQNGGTTTTELMILLLNIFWNQAFIFFYYLQLIVSHIFIIF